MKITDRRGSRARRPLPVARRLVRWALRAVPTTVLAIALVPAAGQSANAQASGAGSWGPLDPVAYGNAQVDLPADWPVVYPGNSSCQGGPGPVPGVALLGSFGSSSWCPPGSSQNVSPPANVVRLGPLPAGDTYASLPTILRNGITLYLAVLHGRISGTVYLVPALGVELMATGPDAGKVLSNIGTSVRERVLAGGPKTAPLSWRRISFAGLRFAVPVKWAVRSTNFLYDCMLPDDVIALASPPEAVFDTDTDFAALPCAYFLPPRVAGDGLVVDAGSSRAANVVPPGALHLRVNGLDAFVDRSKLLSVLLVEVEVPGRSMPVQVHVGLGGATTAARVLGSIEQAGQGAT